MMCFLVHSKFDASSGPGHFSQPGRSFHNSRALKSGDRLVLFSSGTYCDRFWSHKVVKRSVGRVFACISNFIAFFFFFIRGCSGSKESCWSSFFKHSPSWDESHAHSRAGNEPLNLALVVNAWLYITHCIYVTSQPSERRGWASCRSRQYSTSLSSILESTSAIMTRALILEWKTAGQRRPPDNKLKKSPIHTASLWRMRQISFNLLATKYVVRTSGKWHWAGQWIGNILLWQIVKLNY